LSKSKLLYDWRSVSQHVLVSGTPLGPMTRFYFFLSFVGKLIFSSPWAPSLTRGRVCTLQCETRCLLTWLEADPSENTARNNTCCVCWLPWKSCLSGCYLDTDLRKSYLVTGIPNMWEDSMGGSHTLNLTMDVANNWLAILLFIQEVLSSNLCQANFFIFLILTGKILEIYFRLGQDTFSSLFVSSLNENSLTVLLK
jgi:hypothetical protein